VDLISEFFERLRLRGRLFFNGQVDGVLNVKRDAGTALVHLLPAGGVELVRPGEPAIPVASPSILLCPDISAYRLRSAGNHLPRIVCASFVLGRILGDSNPLGLERTLVFEIGAMPQLRPVIDLILHEVEAGLPAHEKALGALFEYMLVLLVRHGLQHGMITRGSLAGLLDPQIGKALQAIHADPDEPWELVRLASLCGMSRSRFSSRFAELTGVPPIAYLAAWRIRQAQELMRQGTALKVVAASVGYGSQVAFTRAFVGQCGVPPGEWLRSQPAQ
jgi:AraC-like DNA-binding protein